MPAGKSRAAEIAVVRPAQPRSSVQAVAGATERRLPGALEVPIEQISPDPTQPRRDWQHNAGDARLAELTASIREFGVLQPLLVREESTLPDGRQRYVIVAGERRYRAAQHGGLRVLPVVVRGESTTHVRVLQLIENLQRQNLSPLDEARAYQELLDLENLTPPEVAARVHVSAQHVRDRLRLLADQVMADAVERRQISARAARDIGQLPDSEVQVFRARIQAGERLQTNDVARARARLAAEGVINPRLKRVEPAGNTGDSATKKQTRFVPPPYAAAPVPPPEAAVATQTMAALPPVPTTSEPVRGEPHQAVTDDPTMTVRLLVAALSAPERAKLIRILQASTQVEWSCAALLAVAEATDR